MTIYVDQLKNYGEKGWWCHCWSDTLDIDELMEFASIIKLDPTWYQTSHGAIVKDFPHFDLRESKRKQAIKKGAVQMSLSFWMKLRYLSDNKSAP